MNEFVNLPVNPKTIQNFTDPGSGIIGRGRILWLISSLAREFRGIAIVNVQEAKLCQLVLSVELKSRKAPDFVLSVGVGW